MKSDKRELVFIIVMMVFLFVLGVGASFAFFRTYVREKRKKDQ
jgi:hypothetical protein